MPLLSLAQLRLMTSERAVYQCGRCGRAVRQNYCREHDEFIETGHLLPECPGTGHDDHRTY